eukprot:9480778-Pyramimonas_sp.AAC.1
MKIRRPNGPEAWEDFRHLFKTISRSRALGGSRGSWATITPGRSQGCFRARCRNSWARPRGAPGNARNGP